MLRTATSPVWRILILATGLMWTVGCADECAGLVCGPCEPPILLFINDAESGGPVESAEVKGELAGKCAGDAATTWCLVFVPDNAPGTYVVKIAAPGYEDLVQTVVVPDVSDVESCCGPCPHVSLDVVMVRLDD